MQFGKLIEELILDFLNKNTRARYFRIQEIKKKLI